MIEPREFDEDEAIKSMFTSERLAHIEMAKADINAGNGLSLQEVVAQLQASRAAWITAREEMSLVEGKSRL